MRWSETFIPTGREVPAEAEIPSHRLLLRAGFMRKLGAGLYTYLPLGLRVIRNIENIIRGEMEKHRAVELLMPVLQPRELWEMSGRWGAGELSMLTVKNRAGREFVLGPTHEEVITSLVSGEIKSYKDLPKNFFQIQTKFRDELRARFGLIRAREFIMKDGYSFDADEKKALLTYGEMDEAYRGIFEKCGLEVQKAEADPGAMGGGLTHEFMAIAGIGEDIIIKCGSCSYAANLETASCARAAGQESAERPAAQSAEHTPGIKTVSQLAGFLSADPSKIIKTIICEIDRIPAAVLTRGDMEINETKLRRQTGASEISMADESRITELTGAPPGFSGPVGLKKIRIIADRRAAEVINAVTGANRADTHLVNVNIGRDYVPDEIMDITYARPGEPCPSCGSPLEEKRGIEVGQIFSLGEKYSRSLGASFLDSDGSKRFCFMGCYGIGVSRTVAAIVEQHHDENGIIWPESVSPYKALVLPLNVKDEKSASLAENLHRGLEEEGIPVLLDDRDERAGVKFKDADLIGIPVRITVGPREFKKGMVEIHSRKDGRTVLTPAEEVSGRGLREFF